MHICYICHEYPLLVRGGGGVGTFLENLSSALRRREHEVSILALGFNGEIERDGAPRVIPVPRRGMGWLAVLRMTRDARRIVKDLHAARPIDIIETSQANSMMLPSSRGTPCVLRFHGAHSLHSYCRGEKPRLMRSAVERWGIRRADFLAAVSKFTVELCRLTLPPVAGREITVLYNGVDTALFAPKQPSENGCRTLLYVGTMNHNKGADRAVAAFASIAHEFPGVRLRMAGRDTIDKNTKLSFIGNALQGLPDEVRSRIEILGALEYAKMPRIYSEAGICVLPSLVENMPMAWIEAMSCGNAVIGGCGVASEVIEDRKTGLICDPRDVDDIADKMRILLRDSELAARLGKQARVKVIRSFSLDATVEENERFYQDCITSFAGGFRG